MSSKLLDYINSYNSIEEFVKNHNLYSYQEKDLILLKYLRNISNLDNQYVKMCRGLILDKNNKKIVCRSFNSRIDYHDFIKKYPIENISITQIVDGTMINIYYYDNKWNFSTKSRIDAEKSRWLNSKSFKTLFNEAVQLNYDNLDINNCYSFILVHPENRIIVRNKIITVYLSQVRNLDTNDIITNEIDASNLGAGVCNLNLIQNHLSYKELEDSLQNRPYDFCGYMLFDKESGDRTRLLVNEYEKLKTLVSRYPNKQQHYLWLDKNNYVIQYFRIFKEEKIAYNTYLANKNKLFSFILDLYHLTRKQFIEYPKYLAKTIYLIHNIYLNNKVSNKKHPQITFNKVKTYFNNLDLKLQDYILTNFLIKS